MENFQHEVSRLRLPTGEELTLSASAGGVVYPTHGEDYISLCRQADAMLYEVKKKGKAHFRVKEIMQ